MKTGNKQPETEHKSHRVLVVDDHPLVREGLSKLIQKDPALTLSGAVGSAVEALQAVVRKMPDVVLADLSLPGTNGLELIKDLRLRHPKLPVLVLSMHEESFYAERALRAGARGYIMKQAPGAQVIEALHTVLRGDLYLSQAIGATLLRTLVVGKKERPQRSGMEQLSDRELQVFECIGRGLTTQGIAAQLHLSVKTIETYRAHIKIKLGLTNSTALTHHAIRWIDALSSKRN